MVYLGMCEATFMHAHSLYYNNLCLSMSQNGSLSEANSMQVFLKKGPNNDQIYLFIFYYNTFCIFLQTLVHFLNFHLPFIMIFVTPNKWTYST